MMWCCAQDEELELELEQWREAWEKRGMKVSRAKTEYMCLNGTPLASVDMQSAQLPQVTEFKYLGSTLQSEVSLGKERNESVEGKDRVHVPKWNAISKC